MSIISKTPKHHKPLCKRQTQDLNKHKNTAHDVKNSSISSSP